MTSPQTSIRNDRRTLKTKRALAAAFKDLVLEKGYDATSIQDIIDRADVGRSTFYAHYESKEQLLVGNINFQESLIDTNPSHEHCPMGINIPYLFHHTKEHLPLCRALSRSKSYSVVSNYFTDVCLNKILQYHKYSRLKKGREKSMLYYSAHAAAGAIISMLTAWLQDGAVIPAEDMIARSKNVLELFFPLTQMSAKS